MAYLPNNSVSSTTTSSGIVTFEDGVIITNDATYHQFSSQYNSEWVRIQGLPKLTIQCEGTANGNAPTYPDSNVGNVRITIYVANNNSGEFEGDSSLNKIKIGEFLVAMTSTAAYDLPALYQEFYSVNAKFCRVKVDFLPNPPVNSVGKLYLRISASN